MEIYPKYAEIDKIQYAINTDYETALACFNAIDDEDINDVERAYAVIGLLFGENTEIRNMDKAIEIAGIYLRCGKEQEIEKSPLDIDFEYDKELISASFLNDYQIDLENVKMHWWKYCALISGLTDTCVLNKVRDVRNYDLNEINDSKIRQKMAKQKQKVALPVKRTKKEKEEIDEFENWLNGDD